MCCLFEVCYCLGIRKFYIILELFLGMKGVFVVLDGVADEGCYALGQKTPLEVAKTENLDWFTSKGKVDYCYTVKKDYVPESNEGVLSLLGYDSFTVTRGPLEAMGSGIDLKSGDLALRCNFSSIDDIGTRNILDRRAGRTLTTKEARILAKAVNDGVKLPFKFEFYPSIQHRGVLVIRGGFNDNISDVEARNGKLEFSKGLDDVDDSKLSADLVNLFVRKSFEVLDKHPINLTRARKGLFSANVLICRGAGSEKVRLKKLRGKWMALGYMPLEKGIARALKMDVYKFKYPKLRGIDVYDNLYAGLKGAIKSSIKMLKRNRKKYDYFYIHFKESDIPGHDNKPLDKVKMIEMMDERFFGFLRKFLREERLVVTADHATACRLKAHSSVPVPLLSWPYSGKRIKGARFTEKDGMKGKMFIGRKVLQERFFGK
jgi:2,3-bisphosphoglycerate-independent phosphoglycerate mutase